MHFRFLLSRPVKLVSLVAGLVLAGLGLTACQQLPHSLLVVGDGNRVAIVQTTIQAGIDTFVVTTNNHTGNGSDITLFQIRNGVSGSQVAAELRDEFSQTPATAARGTRELDRDITAYGLADLSEGTTVKVTANLLPGTYYLMDLGNFTGTGNPVFTRLTVTAGAPRGPLHGDVGVHATGGDRFAAPSSWPHQGTLVFANDDSTSIHFMDLQRVKPGTTDAQVQSYFDSNSQQPPSFGLPGPSEGVDIVSPHITVSMAYNLPPGTYVLLCFVADDSTGMPHALMGMHKVVTLT